MYIYILLLLLLLLLYNDKVQAFTTYASVSCWCRSIGTCPTIFYTCRRQVFWGLAHREYRCIFVYLLILSVRDEHLFLFFFLVFIFLFSYHRRPRCNWIQSYVLTYVSSTPYAHRWNASDHAINTVVKKTIMSYLFMALRCLEYDIKPNMLLEINILFCVGNLKIDLVSLEYTLDKKGSTQFSKYIHVIY